MIDVAESIGLDFYVKRDQWNELQDKKNFKKNCIKYGIPIVETYELTSDFDSDQIPQSVYPVILKPADSCGSKGISICNSGDELKQAIQKGKIVFKNKSILM